MIYSEREVTGVRVEIVAFDPAHGRFHFASAFLALVQVARRLGQEERDDQVQRRQNHARGDELGVAEHGAENVRVQHAETHVHLVEHVRATCNTAKLLCDKSRQVVLFRQRVTQSNVFLKNAITNNYN